MPKFILPLVLALSLVGCAGVLISQPVNQADCHIVQGGSFAGEGMMYFPLGFSNDKD